MPHTVVFAESLTAGAVLAGIRAGRSWIAASTYVTLTVTASTGGRVAGIGERLPVPPATPVLVRVEVRGVPSGTVSLHTERGRVHQETPAFDPAAQWSGRRPRRTPASSASRSAAMTVPWQRSATPSCWADPDGAVRFTPGRSSLLSPPASSQPSMSLRRPCRAKVGRWARLT
ncbi:hypothetical protein GCM10025331_70820 [Actinoplanes utahensis]|nr:hypothetical protein Aut01nite_74800 [Actinoplanes utahensis]